MNAAMKKARGGFAGLLSQFWLITNSWKIL
jgi:hypothetical protein